MSATAHLAIDLGAESGRAILGVLKEGALSLHEVHRFPNRPNRLPSGLHWDFDGLMRAVALGIRLGADRARDLRAPLVSIGVDTWGVDYGLLSASGELLGIPRCYRDGRSAAAFERAVALIGEPALYDATGTQLMPINTLFQLLAQHAAEPETLAAADRLLFMPDLVHQQLTGAAVVESTIASTSQMVDARTGNWAFELLEGLGLPAHMLGAIAPAGTKVGTLLPGIAAATGAGAGVEVIAPGAHDTASAVAAVPAVSAACAAGDERWCFLSSGTWSLLGAELDAPRIDDAARTAPFTNEAGVGSTVRFLKNMTGLWLVEECRREFENRGAAHDYERLTALAAAAAPLRTIIDPSHPPFAAPGEMPEKIARFARETGQPEPADDGALIRCCLESLAVSYRHTLDQLETVLERSFDVIHVVGGGGRNALLNQMTADATRRRVVVGPYEATATGNVLVQAMGLGKVEDLAAVRRISAAAADLEVYEPRDPAPWEAALDRLLHV